MSFLTAFRGLSIFESIGRIQRGEFPNGSACSPSFSRGLVPEALCRESRWAGSRVLANTDIVALLI